MQFPKCASLIRSTATVLVLAALAGCATGPSIRVNQDPAANFSNYRTYGFANPLGTDRPNYSSLLSQYLKTATARELEARGYTYSDRPDLEVNFYVATKEKIQSTSTPTAGPYMGGYYGYRRGYYGVWSGYETEVTQYTEGTLNLDIVDPTRKQLVWEATVVGRVRQETLENLEASVNGVMPQIFAKYPFRAAGAPPPAAAPAP